MEVGVKTSRAVSLRADIAQCLTLIEALETGQLNHIEHPKARILEQKRKLAALELELAKLNA
jgi:hypothetical protein